MISAKTAKANSAKYHTRERNIVLEVINATIKDRCAKGHDFAMFFFDSMINLREDNGFHVPENTIFPIPWEAEKVLRNLGYQVIKKNSWYEIRW